ncbi:hypothetical protein DYU11_26895 [Fibrisoma montanum]|uniref:FAD/NAD(P)-binding domain-containing protein n=1 Tax=Fibrisoma montanum TaxID=2305895 RepID=A0A418M0V7_9BACT|nr:FAD-dependent oxidoreductase [Fibrisoma montanum]RIV19118.1 hypothetical protein DYU11_26895 [Fibrisoma montanum]
MEATTHIVLLGAGYVSVNAYRSLAKALRRQLKTGSVAITVIDPLGYHAHQGWTSETLTGIIQASHQRTQLTDIMPQARLLLGKADYIDIDDKRIYVHLNDGTTQWVPYDHLVLGIGAYDKLALTGSQQYGYQVKGHQALLRTMERIQELVWLASTESPAMAQRLLTFTVVGGGFTGVEIATNLAEYVRLVQKQYPSLRDANARVRLIHSTKHILPGLQLRFDRLVRYAERQIRQYGIEVIPQRRVVELTEMGVRLDDQSFYESGLVITAVGQMRKVLPGTEPFTHDAQKRVYLNKFLQVKGQTDVWGGGDACRVEHPIRPGACPSNALWAIQHGVHIGRNIARTICHKPLKPLTYPGLGQAASLGLGKGVAELCGIQFTGTLAWIMRWFVFHSFMPSRRTMFACMSDWFYLLRTQRRKALQRHSVEAGKPDLPVEQASWVTYTTA